MSVIKKLRERAGMSQAELAGKLGCSPVHVYRLESGIRKITLDLVKKLSKIFNVQPSTFVDDVALVRPALRYPNAPAVKNAPIAHSLFEIVSDAGGKLPMGQFMELMTVAYSWAMVQSKQGREITAAKAKKYVEEYKRTHFPDKGKEKLREMNKKKKD